MHPAQALAHWIVIEVGGRIDGYINLVDTKAENRQLQQRIAALQANVTNMFPVRSDYRKLVRGIDDLQRHMDAVQSATSSASEAVRQRYFPTNAAPSWVGESS